MSATYEKTEHKSISWKRRLIQITFQVVGTLAPRFTARLSLNSMLKPRRLPLSDKAQAFLAGAEHVGIPFAGTFFGGGTLAAYVWGDADKTILLVHGWEGSPAHFRMMAAALVDAGYRVVSFDAPAHGRSTGQQTNLPDYGLAIETVMQHFGPIDAIFGHSFGAASTLFHLATHPELRVRRLILNSSTAGLSTILNL
ncbi:MAG: alpha/beta hydrolase, partial [Proteobacteria bacterium]|nr:alpha/beta hydrolase [Pseudomonadota bacterium]